MATHSSILAWEIPWTEEPGRLQSMGLQRVRDGLETKQYVYGSQEAAGSWVGKTILHLFYFLWESH